MHGGERRTHIFQNFPLVSFPFWVLERKRKIFGVARCWLTVVWNCDLKSYSNTSNEGNAKRPRPTSHHPFSVSVTCSAAEQCNGHKTLFYGLRVRRPGRSRIWDEEGKKDEIVPGSLWKVLLKRVDMCFCRRVRTNGMRASLSQRAKDFENQESEEKGVSESERIGLNVWAARESLKKS